MDSVVAKLQDNPGLFEPIFTENHVHFEVVFGKICFTLCANSNFENFLELASCSSWF